MANADRLIALLKSHFNGDEKRFSTIALQIAAHEAKQGHEKLARELRDLVDAASTRPKLPGRAPHLTPIARPTGELANLVDVRYANVRLRDLVLAPELSARLERVIREHRAREQLHSRGLEARRKLLLVGPPGVGKTMTAEALAGELNFPLFTIRLDGLMTKFLGETASKLRLIFDAMTDTRGVYLFDEFDSIGAKRAQTNDIGEVRRVLNSFLQFLEADQSLGLVIAATNHPELLDRALYRRFDDVLEYALPDAEEIEHLVKEKLSSFQLGRISWSRLAKTAQGLSQADVARAAADAAKAALLADQEKILEKDIATHFRERIRVGRFNQDGAHNS